MKTTYQDFCQSLHKYIVSRLVSFQSAIHVRSSPLLLMLNVAWAEREGERPPPPLPLPPLPSSSSSDSQQHISHHGGSAAAGDMCGYLFCGTTAMPLESEISV